MNRYEYIMVLATVVIALASLANLAAAYLMMRATKDYAQTTKDIFEAAYRPHVSITGITPMCYPDERRITFKVTVKNSGAVPARELSLFCQVDVEGKQIQKSADVTTLALMPQEEVILNVQIHDPEIYHVLVNDAPVVFSGKFSGPKDQVYNYTLYTKYKDRKLLLRGTSGS